MSVAIEVKINDQATPAVGRLVDRLSPANLAARVGPATAQLTRGYLRGLPSNQRGWPTTNFYQRASRATTWTATDGGVTISINQIGFRQRYHGGAIRPVKAKFLTIPIASQAYGKTASDFPGSFIIKTPKGRYIVQYGEQVFSGKTQTRVDAGEGYAELIKTKFNPTLTRQKKGAGLRAALNFLFKLVKSVNQKGNPNILPSDDAYYTVIHQAIREGVK